MTTQKLDRNMEETRKTRIPALLNNREVAAYLNVKETTIRHWVHIGYIPHIKFRGLVRFRQETIDAWLEKCAVGMRRTPKRIAQDILNSMISPTPNE